MGPRPRGPVQPKEKESISRRARVTTMGPAGKGALLNAERSTRRESQTNLPVTESARATASAHQITVVVRKMTKLQATRLVTVHRESRGRAPLEPCERNVRLETYGLSALLEACFRRRVNIPRGLTEMGWDASTPPEVCFRRRVNVPRGPTQMGLDTKNRTSITDTRHRMGILCWRTRGDDPLYGAIHRPGE